MHELVDETMQAGYIYSPYTRISRTQVTTDISVVYPNRDPPFFLLASCRSVIYVCQRRHSLNVLGPERRVGLPIVFYSLCKL